MSSFFAHKGRSDPTEFCNLWNVDEFCRNRRQRWNGGSGLIEPGSEKSSEDLSSKNALPLAMASEGECLRIVSLRGGKGFHEKLVSMGLNGGYGF